MFLGTWVAGGLLAFAGAMAYAELAALRPRAGGEYVYLRAAFGRLAAFLTGWTSFVAGFSGAMAASAVVLAFYVGRFFPAANDPTPLLVIPLPLVPLTFSRQAITALARDLPDGLDPPAGRRAGPVRHERPRGAQGLRAPHLHRPRALARHRLGGQSSPSRPALPRARRWLLALIPVMFTYSGWNAAAYVAEEIHEPGRNVPRALALGTLAVVVIYFLLNLLFLYVLPVGQLAKVQGSVLDVDRRPAARRSRRRHHGDRLDRQHRGEHQRDDVRGTARLLRDGARRPVLPRRRAGPSASTRRRPLAIVAQAVWSSVLVLSGGANALTTYTGFAVVLFAGFAVLSLFVLRQREPDAPRPFRAWGYPLAPADLRRRQPGHRLQRAVERPRRPDSERNAVGTGGRRADHHRPRHPDLLLLRGAKA